MVKNLIDFSISVGFLLSQFLSFAVGLLQLLQPESHTTITGFIKSLIGQLGSEGSPETQELWQSIYSADWDLMLSQKAWNHGVEPWN